MKNRMNGVPHKSHIVAVKAAFWTMLLFWMVFAFVLGIVSRENYLFDAGEVRLLEGPWMVGGELMELPSYINPGTTEVEMTTKLPKEIRPGETLLIKGTHQTVRVKIDGQELVYFDDANERLISRQSPTVMLRVPLRPEDAGKELSITYGALDSYTAGRLHEVRIGSDGAIFLWIIRSYGPDVLSAALLMYSGFLVALFGLIIRFVLKDNPNMNLSYLGVTAILISVWMLGESWARQIYVADLALMELVLWEAIFLAPIPMLFYVNCLLGRRYHNLYVGMSALVLVMNISMVVMQLTGFRDFYEVYKMGWCSLLLAGGLIVGTVIAEWARGFHQYRLTVGTVMMLAAIVVQMVGYINESDVLFQNNYFSIGMILFLIIMGMSAYRSIWMQRQEQEIAERANETKSDFLANMSHEIRTPINAMLGFDEMILREETDPRVMEYALNIKAAGSNLLVLINDILDFSKIEAGHMELVDEDYYTSELLTEVVNQTYIRAREKGLAFDVHVGKTLPRVLHGDDMRVKQIMLNVLYNAVKYTEKGTVTFSINFDKLGEDHGQLRIVVEDTGIGIRKEDLESITNAFQRADLKHNRSIEGTGLGMTIVQSFLDLMGGRMEIQSEYGKGSTFRLLIPQKITDGSEILNYQTDYRDTLKGRKVYREKFTAPQAKILFVDDNIMNLSVARGLLKKTKIQIDTTDSGLGCLELTRQKEYNLIFMDHLMPEMDGIETLNRLRKEQKNPNQNTKVIALTANAIAGSREFYLKSGFEEYMSKPIEGDQLEDLLQRLLPQEYIIPAEEMAENVLDRLKAAEVSKSPAESVVSKEECTNEMVAALEEAHIDIVEGYRYSGKSIGQFHWTIMLFADTFSEKYMKMLEHLRNTDEANYTIEVHALKSNAKGIGARVLAQLAWEHEQQSRAGNWSFIQSHWDELVQEWRVVVDGILAYVGEDPVNLGHLTRKVERTLEPEESNLTNAQQMLVGNAIGFINEFESDPALSLLENLRLETLPPHVVDIVNRAVEDLENFDYAHAKEMLESL